MSATIDPTDGSTPVFPPRHAAEETTGTRLLRRTPEQAVAATRLPDGAEPTLGHLGVLADVAAGQCLSSALPAGQDVRTIGLHLQLIAPLPVRGLVVGTGAPRLLTGGTGLATAEMRLEDGTPAALATLRFMVVEAPTHVADPDPSALTRLDGLGAPADWDPSLGLGTPEADEAGSRRRMTPQPRSGNAAGVLHGGLHVRALELACRSAAELPHADAEAEGFRLADIDVAYHRPVPADGRTSWTLTGRIVRRGRRVIVAEAAITSHEGKLHTEAHATFLRDG